MPESTHAPESDPLPPDPAPTTPNPVTIHVAPDGFVTINVTPPALALADAGLEVARPRGIGEWLRGEPDTPSPLESARQPSAVDEAVDKLKAALKTIGEKVSEFAGDVAVLEVRTFVSDRLNALDDDFFTTEEPRALTRVKLDGDTDVVVPLDEGRLDETLWRIHADTVSQAQAHREAMLRTVLELVRSIVPTVK